MVPVPELFCVFLKNRKSRKNNVSYKNNPIFYDKSIRGC
uniref:Uncharacterized protein n=1 Tax=Rhizophora mucronata TaxID=61149 RepID=A0A2P2QT49_RHIMU